MKRYWIVGNRAFTSEQEAREYCKKSDFDPETMVTEVEETCKGERFYELQTEADSGRIYHNTYLTERQVNSDTWQREIQAFKDGEYTERFVHLKEISRKEYEA